MLRFYKVGIGFGVLCLICGFGLFLFNKSLAQSPIINNNLKNNSPVRLIIPLLKINLPIIEAQIQNNQWEISTKQVNHLITSANPNEANNIVLYGHNKWEILGKLVDIKINDEIDIKTSDGSVYTYIAFDKIVVNRFAVGFIKPTNKEILTIFTCSGWFDSQRLVVQAKPK